MGMQLAASPHDLLVGRVPTNDRDLIRDRLVGARRDDGPLPNLLGAGLALRLRRPLSRFTALPALRSAVAPSAHRRAAPALGALGGALLRRSLRAGRSGRLRTLALAALLGREHLLGLGRLSRRFGCGRILGGLRLRRFLFGLCLGGLLLGLGGLLLGGLFGCLFGLLLFFLGHYVLSSLSRSMPRWRATVISRATSRRAPASAAEFSSSPVAWRKRRLNVSSRACLSRSTRSWSSSAWTSEPFTPQPPRASRTSS